MKTFREWFIEAKIDLEIKPASISTPDNPQWVAVLEVRGRVWSLRWAGEKPTEAQVIEAWKTDRKNFMPGYLR